MRLGSRRDGWRRCRRDSWRDHWRRGRIWRRRRYNRRDFLVNNLYFCCFCTVFKVACRDLYWGSLLIPFRGCDLGKGIAVSKQAAERNRTVAVSRHSPYNLAAGITLDFKNSALQRSTILISLPDLNGIIVAISFATSGFPYSGPVNLLSFTIIINFRRVLESLPVQRGMVDIDLISDQVAICTNIAELDINLFIR